MKWILFTPCCLVIAVFLVRAANGMSSKRFFEILSRVESEDDQMEEYSSQDYVRDYRRDAHSVNKYRKTRNKCACDLSKQEYKVFVKMKIFYTISITVFIEKKCPRCEGKTKKEKVKQLLKVPIEVLVPKQKPKVVVKKVYIKKHCSPKTVIVNVCEERTIHPITPTIIPVKNVTFTTSVTEKVEINTKEPETTKGPVTKELETTKGKIITVSKLETTKLAATTKEPETTEGPVTEELETTTGKIVTVSKLETTKLAATTKEPETTKGPVTKELETTKGPVTKELETTTGKIVTVSKLETTKLAATTKEPETAKRPVTKELETTKGPVTKELETTKGPVTKELETTTGKIITVSKLETTKLAATTKEPETTKGPVTKELEITKRPVTKELEATTGKIVTVSKVETTKLAATTKEPETTKGPVTKELETTKGPVTKELETTTGKIVTVSKMETTKLAATTKEPETTKGPVTEELETTTGKIVTVSKLETTKLAATTKEPETTKGPVTKELETTKRPVTKELEATTGKIVTVSKVETTKLAATTKEPETTKGPVTKELETTKRPVTKELEGTTGKIVTVSKLETTKLAATTKEPERTKGPVTKELETTKRPVTKELEATTGKIVTVSKAETTKLAATTKEPETTKGPVTEELETTTGKIVTVSKLETTQLAATTKEPETTKGPVTEELETTTGKIVTVSKLETTQLAATTKEPETTEGPVTEELETTTGKIVTVSKLETTKLAATTKEPETTKGPVTEELETTTGKIVTVSKLETTQLAATTKEPETTEGPVTEELETTTGKIVTVSKLETTKLAATTKEPETTKGPVTKELETTKGPVTKELETTTGKIVTVSKLETTKLAATTKEPETTKGPVTKELETTKRPVTKELEATTGKIVTVSKVETTKLAATTKEPETTKRPVTKELETTKGPVTKELETTTCKIVTVSKLETTKVEARTKEPVTTERPVTKSLEMSTGKETTKFTKAPVTTKRPVTKELKTTTVEPVTKIVTEMPTVLEKVECPSYCNVCLPQHSSSACASHRGNVLATIKMFFQPLVESRLLVTTLNQSVTTTLELFKLFRFSSHYVTLYMSLFRKTLTQKWLPEVIHELQGNELESFKDYFALAEFLEKKMKLQIGVPILQNYVKLPRRSYQQLTEVSAREICMDDKYFVHERLVGVNPLSISRVTIEDNTGTSFHSLYRKLNHNFRWEKLISRLTGKSLIKSISSHLVYVLQYPFLKGLGSPKQSVKSEIQKNSQLLKLTSPIAVLVSTYNREERRYELEIVAIQINSNKRSRVYTPRDGLFWDAAKARLQAADLFFSLFHRSFVQTNLRMMPFCISLNRHVSEIHPFHQVMKFHCRGTIPITMKRIDEMFANNPLLDNLFPVGVEGILKMMARGLKEARWNDMDLDNDIENRGMDDIKKVPYYPYRDDGKVLNAVLKKFAKEFVSLYYENDDDVKDDFEMQNFINELSSNGKIPPNDGLGMVKGLPGTFTSREQLEKLVSETLWVIVQNGALKNAIGDYGSLAPVYPSKLYASVRALRERKYIHMIAGPRAAYEQAAYSYAIGAFHYDVLFDYSSELKDDSLRDLVRKTHDHLMCDVKRQLEARNAKRRRRGQLTNPYMVPGWITNSVST
ncbi:uncharacterized protein LOC135687664 [Rhopilema esculentum]|uniref:uncharacterized protein LOC135687664 n=1 Tax=Rhopilema esculentum TaxID=499914 RepID=UPI0031E10211